MKYQDHQNCKQRDKNQKILNIKKLIKLTKLENLNSNQ